MRRLPLTLLVAGLFAALAVSAADAPSPKAKKGSALQTHIRVTSASGSKIPANLFPERADAAPGYRIKDVLENKAHDLVCNGRLSLRAARRQIASDWEALYTKTFGTAPAG